MSSSESPSAAPRLRVGAVPYLVARPLLYGLDRSSRIELAREVPSGLVRGLREGRLDVALASSIELFRSPGCTAVPEIAIAAFGEVLSVRLFLRRPWREVRTIALDPSSETASALLRAIAAAQKKEAVEWLAIPPGRDPREAAADAFLRIGDEALRETLLGKFEWLDLGEAWRDLTGLPFVYALWIVRPGLRLDGEIIEEFREAARAGTALRRSLALQGSRETGIPFSLVNRYLLEICRYRLGEEGLRGLREFRDRAARLDLCRGDLEVRFQ